MSSVRVQCELALKCTSIHTIINGQATAAAEQQQDTIKRAMEWFDTRANSGPAAALSSQEYFSTSTSITPQSTANTHTHTHTRAPRTIVLCKCRDPWQAHTEHTCKEKQVRVREGESERGRKKKSSNETPKKANINKTRIDSKAAEKQRTKSGVYFRSISTKSPSLLATRSFLRLK